MKQIKISLQIEILIQRYNSKIKNQTNLSQHLPYSEQQQIMKAPIRITSLLYPSTLASASMRQPININFKSKSKSKGKDQRNHDNYSEQVGEASKLMASSQVVAEDLNEYAAVNKSQQLYRPNRNPYLRTQNQSPIHRLPLSQQSPNIDQQTHTIQSRNHQNQYQNFIKQKKVQGSPQQKIVAKKRALSLPRVTQPSKTNRSSTNHQIGKGRQKVGEGQGHGMEHSENLYDNFSFGVEIGEGTQNKKHMNTDTKPKGKNQYNQYDQNSQIMPQNITIQPSNKNSFLREIQPIPNKQSSQLRHMPVISITNILQNIHLQNTNNKTINNTNNNLDTQPRISQQGLSQQQQQQFEKEYYVYLRNRKYNIDYGHLSEPESEIEARLHILAKLYKQINNTDKLRAQPQAQSQMIPKQTQRYAAIQPQPQPSSNSQQTPQKLKIKLGTSNSNPNPTNALKLNRSINRQHILKQIQVLEDQADRIRKLHREKTHIRDCSQVQPNLNVDDKDRDVNAYQVYVEPFMADLHQDYYINHPQPAHNTINLQVSQQDRQKLIHQSIDNQHSYEQQLFTQTSRDQQQHPQTHTNRTRINTLNKRRQTKSLAKLYQQYNHNLSMGENNCLNVAKSHEKNKIKSNSNSNCKLKENLSYSNAHSMSTSCIDKYRGVQQNKYFYPKLKQIVANKITPNSTTNMKKHEPSKQLDQSLTKRYSTILINNTMQQQKTPMRTPHCRIVRSYVGGSKMQIKIISYPDSTEYMRACGYGEQREKEGQQGYANSISNSRKYYGNSSSHNTSINQSHNISTNLNPQNNNNNLGTSSRIKSTSRIKYNKSRGIDMNTNIY